MQCRPIPTSPLTALFPETLVQHPPRLLLWGVSEDCEILWVPGRLRVLRIHRFERCAHNRGDRRVARPFTVCWNNVPRRPRRGAPFQHHLVSMLVIVPQLAIFEIAGLELPTA